MTTITKALDQALADARAEKAKTAALVEAKRASYAAARALYVANTDAKKATELLHAREKGDAELEIAVEQDFASDEAIGKAEAAIADEQRAEAQREAAIDRTKKLAELERQRGVASESATRADVIAGAREIHALKRKMRDVVARVEARRQAQSAANAAAVALAKELEVDFAPEPDIGAGLLRVAVAREELRETERTGQPCAPLHPLTVGCSRADVFFDIARGALDINPHFDGTGSYSDSEQVDRIVDGTHYDRVANLRREAKEQRERDDAALAEREAAEAEAEAKARAAAEEERASAQATRYAITYGGDGAKASL